MMSAPSARRGWNGHCERRCVLLDGRRRGTSLALELGFWRVVDFMARETRTSVSQVARFADSRRRPSQALAAAVRELALEAVACSPEAAEAIRTRPLPS